MTSTTPNRTASTIHCASAAESSSCCNTTIAVFFAARSRSSRPSSLVKHDLTYDDSTSTTSV